MPEKIALTLNGLLIPLGLALVVVHARFLTLMRRRHPRVFHALGHPRIIRARSVSETLCTLRYLWRRAYLGTNHPQFVSLGDWLRRLHLAYAGLILFTMILFCVHILTL